MHCGGDKTALRCWFPVEAKALNDILAKSGPAGTLLSARDMRRRIHPELLQRHRRKIFWERTTTTTQNGPQNGTSRIHDGSWNPKGKGRCRLQRTMRRWAAQWQKGCHITPGSGRTPIQPNNDKDQPTGQRAPGGDAAPVASPGRIPLMTSNQQATQRPRRTPQRARTSHHQILQQQLLTLTKKSFTHHYTKYTNNYSTKDLLSSWETLMHEW